MITVARGDLLAHDDVEALVNAVNCVGVAGKGIALAFRKKWPENFKAYESMCKVGVVRPGRTFVFDRGEGASPRYLINFPTKDHWRDPSRIAFIRDGLSDLVSQIRNLGIRSIAVPAIGCGLGGLSWDEVKPLVVGTLGVVEGLDVRLFEPGRCLDRVAEGVL